MHFDLRLWRLTAGLRDRIAWSVLLGLLSLCVGIARFAFLLALIFLAWFGYTAFSTQFAVDDVVERVLIVAQVFLVAVMAA